MFVAVDSSAAVADFELSADFVVDVPAAVVVVDYFPQAAAVSVPKVWDYYHYYSLPFAQKQLREEEDY